ncbi:MAG: amidohydrolase family protein [Sphingomonadales bacterium]
MPYPDYDIVIRGGMIVDGSGDAPFSGDVAIRDGTIVVVGAVAGTGRDEIDASGSIVTPGFVDVHTHYDGQVTWESRTSPSSAHGVTTVVTGNCGVGFAPCRPDDRNALVHLMEGIEDIPEIVMTDGLPWSWETFPQYLEVVAAAPRDIDVATQLPHSCLRVFVMGERGLRGEAATASDLVEMRALAREAMKAGALGFGTSRTLFHRSSDGRAVPTKTAHEDELTAIADGMTDAGHGVIQAVIEMLDRDELLSELDMLGRVVARSGRPASFSLVQMPDSGDAWNAALARTRQLNADGIPVSAQTFCRGNGVLLGLDLSYNPFSRQASYHEIAHLPLAEKVEAMRDPARRARILAEPPSGDGIAHLNYLSKFEAMFALGERPDYEPDPDESIAAIAARRGSTPAEVAYDAMLENDGNAILFLFFANFSGGNLDAVREMLTDPHALWGLGDGGAHYGMVCDSSFTTFLLTHWARDRDHDRLALPLVVHGLTRKPALAVGLHDRGLVAPGYKADLNVIDHRRLSLAAPRVVRDLPAEGRRLIQDADGYVATLVGGVVIQRNGIATDALPGRLVRGPQPDPAPVMETIA